MYTRILLTAAIICTAALATTGCGDTTGNKKVLAARKWNITKITSVAYDKMPPGDRHKADSMLKLSYLDLKPDGKMDVEFLGQKSSGKWWVSGDTLITQAENGHKTPELILELTESVFTVKGDISPELSMTLHMQAAR